jgi:hypothetical protein
MSTIKISELPVITGANTAEADVLPIVDTSLSTTNKITRAEFFKNVPDMEINDKIIHSGDTNTAIRFPAADTVTVETSGVERLRIDSSGNVGIGTNAPGEKVVIEGATPFLLINNTDESKSGVRFADAQNTGERFQAVYDAGAAAFTLDRVESTGVITERMRITSAGNVGIGTTSPSNLLTVKSATTSAAAWFQNTGATDQTITLGDPDTIANNCGVYGRTTGSFVFQNSGGAFVWKYASGTERMRIDSNGNLLVGKTGVDDATAGVSLYGTTTGPYISAVRAGVTGVFNRLTSNGDVVVFRKDSVTVGTISVTGAATAYNTSSDYRLKESIQPIFGASDRVRQLNPVNFAWKADGTRTDGFIAHEVQAVAPQAVTGEKDGEEMQAIDHSKLVPLLTAALQEALTEIALLKARLDTANI